MSITKTTPASFFAPLSSLKPLNGLDSLGDAGGPSSASAFLDMLKQPLNNTIASSLAHEQAVIGAAENKVSSLELLQAATQADLSLQEFKAYWDRFMTAANDIMKLTI